jgi:hypothetical protein
MTRIVWCVIRGSVFRGANCRALDVGAPPSPFLSSFSPDMDN